MVRTRLREETNGKRGFFRTLYGLYKEGYRSMYRGLSVQVRLLLNFRAFCLEISVSTLSFRFFYYFFIFSFYEQFPTRQSRCRPTSWSLVRSINSESSYLLAGKLLNGFLPHQGSLLSFSHDNGLLSLSGVLSILLSFPISPFNCLGVM